MDYDLYVLAYLYNFFNNIIHNTAEIFIILKVVLYPLI